MSATTDYLKRLLRGTPLDAIHTREMFGEFLDGKASKAQMGAVLAALRMKGERSEELVGAAQAVIERSSNFCGDYDVVDTCGTGNGSAPTFNVSTAAAIVAATLGASVLKHVAPKVTSRCGSREVLDTLRVRFSGTPIEADASIREHGIAFVAYDAALPQMRELIETAAELEARTIVDILVPFTNPATPRFQVVGATNVSQLMPIARALGELGRERVWVVRGNDGIDELTVTEASQVVIYENDAVTKMELDPRDYGLELWAPESIRGGTPVENASMMHEVLSGKRTGSLRDFTALNAAATLVVAGVSKNLMVGVESAKQALTDGSPWRLLKALTV
ncbi:MAG: anthranilate phosphoribosyltransferase [Clostridia bacterium]|nr:anthranilate phosphoribosyltransferase [Deltaproteobacteria bacterium]